MAKKKDYYKILGVRRNADKRQIMKAYRKLAQQWHPDNFQNEAEKQRAQEKVRFSFHFTKINLHILSSLTLPVPKMCSQIRRRGEGLK
jgi:hypothetical protein